MELKLTPIPGHSGYWITKEGVIWEKRKPPRPNTNGYSYYCILGRAFQLGHLLLITFVGPCPSGMECHHKDGNPQNNVLDNLTWATASEHRGCRKKLTVEQVAKIEQLLADGATGRSICRRYGISYPTVTIIKKGLYFYRGLTCTTARKLHKLWRK